MRIDQDKLPPISFFKKHIDLDRASFIEHEDGRAWGYWTNICGDYYDIWYKVWNHNTEMMIVTGKHFTITYKIRRGARGEDPDMLVELKVKYFHKNRAEDSMTNLLVASV